jgi:hypothetical protein
MRFAHLYKLHLPILNNMDSIAGNNRKRTLGQEASQSPIRKSQDTKKTQRKYVSSFFLPSFDILCVRYLSKGIRKYRVATYFERVEGPPFLFVSSFYLHTYFQRYVGHTYVLNSNEGLTDWAQLTL